MASASDTPVTLPQGASFSLPRYTMFNDTPIFNINGEYFFGLRQPSILPSNTDRQIEVTQAMAGRLDKIAYDFFGSEQLWWVIADLNPSLDPVAGVEVGVVLRIPTQDRLTRLLT